MPVSTSVNIAIQRNRPAKVSTSDPIVRLYQAASCERLRRLAKQMASKQHYQIAIYRHANFAKQTRNKIDRGTS